ncbi:uncharacterized protein LOC131437647 [Malaya genurostris]|uniref:uncharacterized protein LOC131437647 n=1 Tax=Malaya genurostris TaxID=325434 RepID=UPI0026F3EB32|nr:uncharacterized protein LOC131437647 [Malaya genurostris]
MFVILLAFLALGMLCRTAPVDITSNKTTIGDIGAFFEHAFSDLTGAVIDQKAQNSTQHLQSSDGNIQAHVEPLNFASLQSIIFNPNHHQLIIKNKTVLYNNGSTEVEQIKVSLSTAATSGLETSTVAIVDTTKNSASEITTSNSIGSTDSTANSRTDNSFKSSTTPSVVLTSVSSLATNPIISTTTSTSIASITVDNASEIKEKIKEIEADPVILSVIV